jgi:tRNA threonylcarbamoyladenosine biosynthesis protein TsaB
MKNEALLLHIETATTVCSVALSRGSDILAVRELDAGYTHAENLHLFIDQVLKEAQHTPSDLDAVSLSSGPGSYTGLRIGSSTAKGLCFALNIPLITLGTLQIMAAGIGPHRYSHICPMIDAGRMEVYTAAFKRDLEQVVPVQALIIDEKAIQDLRRLAPVLFIGQGMEKAKHLLERVEGAAFKEGIRPSARHMISLGVDAFEKSRFTQVRDFEPFYLKNFVAGKAKNNK